MTTTFTTKKLVLASIFTALSIVIGYLEIPWPLSAWLKLDFSEVVILLSLIVLGFRQTAAVIVLRSIIRWLVSGKNADLVPFFGEFMAITASFVIVGLYLLSNFLLRQEEPLLIDHKDSIEKSESYRVKIIRGSVIVIGLTLIMTAFNFFIATPLYMSGGQYIYFSNFIKDPTYQFVGKNVTAYFWFTVSMYVPFNAAKAFLVMVIFEIFKKRMKEMDI